MDDLFEITDSIYVEVSEWKGQKRVDIRRWYNDKETGELKRTGKGINLSYDEFLNLVRKMETLEEYVNERYN